MRYCGLLFVLIVLFFSFAAKADIIGTVDMQYVGYGANSSLTLWGGGNYELDTRGGVHMFEKTGSTGQGDLIDNGLIAGFCMDLAEWRSNDELTYNLEF